ncbi:MAG: GntR family transcriptional regulator [Pseudomonadota bacterium]
MTATQQATAGQTQSDRAVEIIKHMILTNELPPGSNHLESELALMLGMSRTPVREAALLLEAQGLVDIRPRHGIRVLPLTARDMEEIYQILTELEPLAAQLVAERKPDNDVLGTLQVCIDAMEQALAEEDRNAWADADHAFHRQLVSLAGNTRLLVIFNTYSDQVQRARLLTLNMRPLPVKSNEDHRRLLDAIRSGDGEAARAIHHRHRVEAKELMLRLLETAGMTRF